MLTNVDIGTAKDILDTVIDNGRVELSTDSELADQGISCRASLVAEIEAECSNRDITSEAALEDIVNYALAHCSHD